jgi:hypothetical protein
MISAAIATFILLAVLTSFLMLGRTGANIQNYTELEDEARKALETFSRDARLAVSVASGYSSTSVTLSIPDTTASRTSIAYTATYTFDAANQKFTRTITPTGGTATTTTLVNNVQQITGVNPFNYYRYVTTGYQSGFGSNTAGNVVEIKQIEVNFLAKRTSSTVASASNKVLSARFILRNK